jgi:hypothetical protein
MKRLYGIFYQDARRMKERITVMYYKELVHAITVEDIPIIESERPNV